MPDDVVLRDHHTGDFRFNSVRDIPKFGDVDHPGFLV
jgi:hypothetical protein